MRYTVRKNHRHVNHRSMRSRFVAATFQGFFTFRVLWCPRRFTSLREVFFLSDSLDMQPAFLGSTVNKPTRVVTERKKSIWFSSNEARHDRSFQAHVVMTALEPYAQYDKPPPNLLNDTNSTAGKGLPLLPGILKSPRRRHHRASRRRGRLTHLRQSRSHTLPKIPLPPSSRPRF